MCPTPTKHRKAIRKLTDTDWFDLMLLVEDRNQRGPAEEQNLDLEQKLLDIVYGPPVES